MAEQNNRGVGRLRFADWFAGIGGFRLGLERAGHSCVWSCEINPFSRAVYAARFGAPPEAEDVTRFEAAEIPEADLWTAGFPCQDVSTAGLRGGLGASRSGLVWTLLDLAAEARPKWILLENVPGLLQFRDGFGELLARLDDLGYVGAWRVLDAQHFGVPQRRRRVFILAGRSGECRPDEVLLEPESVRGRASSRRKAWSGSPEGAHGGAGGGVEKPLLGHAGKRDDYDTEDLIASTVQAHHGRGAPDDLMTLAFNETGPGWWNENAEYRPGFTWSPRALQVTHPENRSRCEPGEPAPTLAKQSSPHVAIYSVHPDAEREGVAKTAGVAGVRRLTPRECERLQGFPDDWTLVGCGSDSQRYKAIGNSVAVPVIRWIGERLK